jgi:hypothetical protein
VLPFVRIRTTWSDDTRTETDHLEEWFAAFWVLAVYADAALWAVDQIRPVRAVLFERVWLPAVAGPAQ